MSKPDISQTTREMTDGAHEVARIDNIRRNERRRVVEAALAAIRKCPSLDADGYICEKASALHAVSLLLVNGVPTSE